MSKLGQIMTYFPALVLCGTVASIVTFISTQSGAALLAIPLWLYGAPLLAHRAHMRRYPLAEGGSHLIGEDYSAWYGSHQIQLIYIALPFLERLLRLVPGLFSAWLRLWGSSVGARVYWTPALEISDRSLLDVGDDVIFGHRVSLYPHLIKPTKKNMLLYLKRIEIGAGAFIGGGTVMGPGVSVDDGAFVEVGSHLYPNSGVEA